MKRLKRILLILGIIILTVIIIWGIWNRELLRYGYSQLRGQLNIVMHTEDIQDILHQNKLPDSLGRKLLLIQEVRRFAMDSLGLKDTKSYTRWYDQKGKPVLKVLTACEPFALKAYEWEFPFLGSVSYKGYFDFEAGEKEKLFLDSLGYDTDYGPVSAWSTLGWFKDPVLSGMLRRSEGQLAELIIHEMTHATCYLKSNVQFNENLASAIGEYGAERYLRSLGASGEDLLKQYMNQEHDYNLFSAYMLRSAGEMKTLYDSISAWPYDEKSKAKKLKLSTIISGFNALEFYDTLRYRNLYNSNSLNNAVLMGFIRYDAKKEELRMELENAFGGNIPAFLNDLKKRYN